MRILRESPITWPSGDQEINSRLRISRDEGSPRVPLTFPRVHAIFREQPSFVKRPLSLSLILLAILICAGIAPLGSQAQTRDEQFVSATRVGSNTGLGTRFRVTALGRLEPHDEIVEIAAPFPGRLERLLVQEGQQVEAGTILAYLDSHAERLAERDCAAKRLKEVKTRFAADTALAESQVREAELRLRRLEEILPLEIEAQKEECDRLEVELRRVKRDLERLENLEVNRAVTEQELEHQRLLVRTAETQLRRSKIIYTRLEKGREIDLQLAETQLETARASLKKVHSSSEIGSASENLKLAEARLEQTVIRSPSKGEILQILRRPGESTGQRPLMQIGDTSQMYAVAEVFENDIQYVRVGQKATVKSRAMLESLPGMVECIHHVVLKNRIFDLDPTAEVDRRVVEVKIRLQKSDLARPLVNLQVDVEIEVEPSR